MDFGRLWKWTGALEHQLSEAEKCVHMAEESAKDAQRKEVEWMATSKNLEQKCKTLQHQLSEALTHQKDAEYAKAALRIALHIREAEAGEVKAMNKKLEQQSKDLEHQLSEKEAKWRVVVQKLELQLKRTRISENFFKDNLRNQKEKEIEWTGYNKNLEQRCKTLEHQLSEVLTHKEEVQQKVRTQITNALRIQEAEAAEWKAYERKPEQKCEDLEHQLSEEQKRVRMAEESAKDALRKINDWAAINKKLELKCEDLELLLMRSGELLHWCSLKQLLEKEAKWRVDVQKLELQLKRKTISEKFFKDNLSNQKEKETEWTGYNKNLEQRCGVLKQQLSEARVGFPKYWKCQSSSFMLWDNTRFMKNYAEEWLKTCKLHNKCGFVFDDTARLSNVVVQKVWRVENPLLWEIYQKHRKLLVEEYKKFCPPTSDDYESCSKTVSNATQQPEPASKSLQWPLDKDANEFLLFHGTRDLRTAEAIAQKGFDVRHANPAGLYGKGLYFTDMSCKSAQYARKSENDGTHVILFCRVTMGWPCFVKKHRPKEAAAPRRNKKEFFDRVFAQAGQANSGGQQHNEYVVYKDHQVYPEFIVQFKEE